jgi:DNA-binding transcriptional ArsR family regulator
VGTRQYYAEIAARLEAAEIREDGMSVTEISITLGVSQQVVSATLKRALDKVRAALLAKGLTEAALRDLLADEPPVGEGRGFDEDASAAYSARRGYYLPSTR